MEKCNDSNLKAVAEAAVERSVIDTDISIGANITASDRPNNPENFAEMISRNFQPPPNIDIL